MDREFADLLTSYLMRWKTLYDCEEWLAGIDWENPDLDSESLKVAGLLELLATEVAEGLRSEADFRSEAARFIRSKVDSPRYVIPTSTEVISSSGNVTERSIRLTRSAEEVERLPSWSISPQLVSV